jgi:hypothetical protein
MGHIRLGRLPKTLKWKQVIGLLADGRASVKEIAESTAAAAANAFNNFNSDNGLSYCYWLLTQITWHAKSEDFYETLESLGLDICDETSALGFISKVSSHADAEIKDLGETTIFTEIAQLSMREILTEIIVECSRTLFGTTPEDIRIACASLATKKQFGLLSRQFFSNFLNRTLQFFISKEISNHVGVGKSFEDIEAVEDFEIALDAFCYQSSKIVEDFAGGWYSKRNWEGDISLEDSKKFVHVAVEKLRSELAMEVADKR